MLIYLIGIITGLLIYIGKISIDNYSMSYSYYLLLPTTIYFKKVLESYSPKYIVLFSISLILILTYGSRGPILSLAVFLVLYQLMNLKKITNFKLISNFLLFVLLLLFSIFFEKVVIYFNDTLDQLGIRSRTAILFMQDEVRTSGRESIYSKVINGVINNPFIGNGIAGDRVINSNIENAKYSHNIAIEILSSFGIIAGSIIIVLLFIIAYLSLFKIEREDSNFLLIWFVVGFVPLFVSSSFLIYFQFWIYLGLTMKYLKISNIKNHIKSNKNP
jgi:hypothetical protein